MPLVVVLAALAAGCRTEEPIRASFPARASASRCEGWLDHTLLSFVRSAPESAADRTINLSALTAPVSRQEAAQWNGREGRLDIYEHPRTEPALFSNGAENWTVYGVFTDASGAWLKVGDAPRPICG